MRAPRDFVQVGATRDGLDTYLDCARRRGLRAVLVETPAYLSWRRRLGRRPFDVEVPVDQPQHGDRVAAALAGAGVDPALVLTGFERYVYAAFELARELGVPPWPRAGAKFTAPDKQEQRLALAHGAPRIRQPRWLPLAGGEPGVPDDLTYPQVVKPVDGGGGLGVLLVTGPRERARALARLGASVNYGGGDFRAVIAEEYVAGPEQSLQGVVHGGHAHLLGVCDKLTGLEPTGEPGISGFREIGHVLSHGTLAPPGLRELAQDAVDAVGYREGPFHIDVLLAPEGPTFVEMGFRLSGGGLAALVPAVGAPSWAEAVFAAHLDDAPPVPTAPSGCAGRLAARTPEELAAARELTGVDVEVALAPPVPADDLTAAELAVLGSDLARHTGAAGVVMVHGDTAAAVGTAMRSVVRRRTGR